jgi:hypothetical protein
MFMTLRILCATLTALWLPLMASCGSDSSAGNSGEYVSSSWHDDTVAHLLVKPTGEISGYLLVMYGWVYEMTGSVSSSGTLTLSVKDPVTQQPVPGTTSTGSCDGAGTCTGTTYAGPNQPFEYVLVRVTPQTNGFAGIYKAPLTLDDSTPSGISWFGIDSNGKAYGFQEGLPRTNSTSLIGDVVATSGDFTLENTPSGSTAVTISGNIGSDGSINNGTWHTSLYSGKLYGSKLSLY